MIFRGDQEDCQSYRSSRSKQGGTMEGRCHYDDRHTIFSPISRQLGVGVHGERKKESIEKSIMCKYAHLCSHTIIPC